MFRLRARPVLSLLLATLLAATSFALASARGQTMADGGIILCGGTALVSTGIGPDGEPAGPAHVCPDMALAMLAGMAVDAPLLRPVLSVRPAMLSLRQTRTVLFTHRQPFAARGPPALTSA